MIVVEPVESKLEVELLAEGEGNGDGIRGDEIVNPALELPLALEGSSSVDEAIGDVVGELGEDIPPVTVPLPIGSGVGPTAVIASDDLEDPKERAGLETHGIERELEFPDHGVDDPVVNRLELEVEPVIEGEDVTSTLRRDSVYSVSFWECL